MKVERVEPIPIMRVYEVTTYTCTVPDPDDADNAGAVFNTFTMEDETEVDEPGSPIDIKNMEVTQINTALTDAEISQIGVVSLGGRRLDDAASEEL